jgi:hypothetical protein
VYNELVALAGGVFPVNDEALDLLAAYEAHRVLGPRFRSDMLHIALATGRRGGTARGGDPGGEDVAASSPQAEEGESDDGEPARRVRVRRRVTAPRPQFCREEDHLVDGHIWQKPGGET